MNSDATKFKFDFSFFLIQKKFLHFVYYFLLKKSSNTDTFYWLTRYIGSNWHWPCKRESVVFTHIMLLKNNVNAILIG